MILQGRNLIIRADGVAIAAARSCSVSIQAEQIPISSPMSGAWAAYLNGVKSWSVSTNHLVKTLRNALMVGTQVSLEFGVEGDGLPFGGFVDNPTLQSGACPTTPTAIVWDKTRKKFLAFLYSGDYLFYQTWEGNQPTCKLLKVVGSRMELHSRNPDYAKIVLPAETEVEMFAVTGVVRMLHPHRKRPR